MAKPAFKVQRYLQLLRIRHWIKNILIFIPLFFSTGLFDVSLIANAVFGFMLFSLLSSVIYIFNDIRDIEKDRLHSTKCLRPLASGEIPAGHAIIALVILSAILLALLVMQTIFKNSPDNLKSTGLLVLYAILNIAYSCGLKNIPIVDVTILASGYVIRVLFGAMITGIDISVWLYLMIILGAYYLGLGKRRNEIADNGKETRTVMQFYSHNFLDKNMYVCYTLCMVFYALWSIDSVTIERFNTSAFVYTIPLLLIIFLKYSLNIETDTDGDPTSVILRDKILLSLCGTYIICAFCIIYLGKVVP